MHNCQCSISHTTPSSGVPLTHHTLTTGDKMTIVLEDAVISCVVTDIRPRAGNGEQLHDDPAQYGRLMQPLPAHQQIPTKQCAEAIAAGADALPPCASGCGIEVVAETMNRLDR